VVAVRFHNHSVVHGQLGRLPHRVPAGHARRVVGRLVQTVQDTVRSAKRFRGDDVLPEDGRHRNAILRVECTDGR